MRTLFFALVVAVVVGGSARADFEKPLDTGTIVKPKTTLKTDGSVTSISWSPDGKLVATTSDKMFMIWNVDTGKLKWRFAFNSDKNPHFHTGPLTSLAFSPDGKTIASASTDAMVKLWDVESAKFVLSSDTLGGTCRGLAWSPDGKTISVGVDATLILLDAQTLKTQASITGKKGEHYEETAYTSDGKLLATSDSGAFHFYDSSSGKDKATWPVDGGIQHFTITGDGKLVATTFWMSSNPKDVAIRDGATGKVKVSIKSNDTVNSIQFSPDGKRIVLSGQDKAAHVADVASGKVLATFQGHENGVISARFSPDGKMLATGGAGTAYLWDVP